MRVGRNGTAPPEKPHGHDSRTGDANVWSTWPVKRIEDPAAVTWLEDDAKAPIFAGIEPSGYPAYARLFHAIYEAPGGSDPAGLTYDDLQRDEVTQGRSTVIGGINLDEMAVASGVSLGWTVRPPGWRRLRWQGLARRHGLIFQGTERNERLFGDVFQSGSWPASLRPPPEGSLDLEGFLRLVQLLHESCGDSQVTAHYCMLATRDWSRNLLFRGSLTSIVTLALEAEVCSSPQNWWSEDRSWVVYTDWDLTTTTVCGPDVLIERLVSDEFLECYRVP